MTITIETAALKAALVSLTVSTKGHGAVIASRSTIPVLSCALIMATAEGIAITGTDLDIQARTIIPGEGRPGVALAINARDLKASVSKIKAARVTLTDMGDKRATLAPEGMPGGVRLATCDAADFPMLPVSTGDLSRWSVPAAQLRDDLARVMIAVSTEKVRYYLNGVYFHAAQEYEGAPVRFRMACTDGHRLARIDRPAPAGFETAPDFILPRLTAAFMGRVIAKAEGLVPIMSSKSRFVATVGGWEIASKCVDGTFPDYGRVIPSHCPNVAGVSPAELATEIDAVMSVSSERIRGVTLSVGTDWATLYHRCADNGPAGTDQVSAEHIDGEPFHVMTNGRYLIDALGAFDKGQKIRIRVSDATAPFIIDAPVSAPEYLIVQMPMRGADKPVTPETIARLNETPLDTFEREAPAKIAEVPTWEGRQRRAAAADFGGLIRRAIDHVAGPVGDRRAARLTILARLAAMRGDHVEAFRLVSLRDHAPEPGAFKAWVFLATAAEVRAASRPVYVQAEPLAGEVGELLQRIDALTRRNARLAACNRAYRQRNGMLGEALARSQERTARLQRQLATSGASLGALVTAG